MSFWDECVKADRRRMAASREPAEVHGIGCPCWDCVLRLHGEVARHRAELYVAHYRSVERHQNIGGNGVAVVPHNHHGKTPYSGF